MKTILMLASSAAAITLSRPAVYTTMRHWNEDPHSTPSPMVGGPGYLTSTQARFEKEGSTLNKAAQEPEGNLPGWFASTGAFQGPYNANDAAYLGLRMNTEAYDDDDFVQTEAELKWHVSPDYGELDGHVLDREADGAFYDGKGNGDKLGGWTNPLSWTDNGTDDDQVV